MLKNATHLLATHLLGFSKIQNGPYYQQMDWPLLPFDGEQPKASLAPSDPGRSKLGN
jgi:hypothetical protein